MDVDRDPKVATLDGAPFRKHLGIPLAITRYRGGSFRTHFHSFLELVISNGSHGHNIVAGTSYNFRPRQCFELGMFHPHRIEAVSGNVCDYYNVTFHPEILNQSAAGPHDDELLLAPFYATSPAEPHVLPQKTYARAVTVCESILAETKHLDRYSVPVVLGQFQALLALVARHRPKDRERSDPRVQRAVRIITERFDEPLETRELARMVDASPSRLAQLFRETTGSTIRHVLLRRRLTEAKRLLATTDMPITRVLHESGFNDVSYFNRTFRRDTGLTPSHYRRRIAREPAVGYR